MVWGLTLTQFGYFLWETPDDLVDDNFEKYGLTEEDIDINGPVYKVLDGLFATWKDLDDPSDEAVIEFISKEFDVPKNVAEFLLYEGLVCVFHGR